MNFWQWLRTCIGMNRVSSRMKTLETRIRRLQKEKQKSDNAIEDHRYEIDRLQKKLNDQLSKTRQELDRAEGLNRRMQRVLDAAHEELKNYDEIVVPGLVAANRVLIDRWDAETRVHAMRVVAAAQGNAQRNFD